MATYGFNDLGFLLVDGYDVTGLTIQMQDQIQAIYEETHGGGDSWIKQSFVGLKRAKLSHETFYDDDTRKSSDAFVGKAGNSRVVCYAVQGNTAGKKFMGFSGALEISQERRASRGALHKMGVEYEGSGVVEEGHIHFTHATRSSGGNSSSVDNSASSANGGSGYLQVSALTLGGFTNVTMKIQHSTDDSTYADLITFTAVTAAPTAERKTVSGTVNRYTRSNYAFSGAGSGQSVTFMSGFFRN